MCSKSPLLRVRKIDPCFWDRYVVWLTYCWYWHVPTWAAHFFSFSLLLGTTYLHYVTLRCHWLKPTSSTVVYHRYSFPVTTFHLCTLSSILHILADTTSTRRIAISFPTMNCIGRVGFHEFQMFISKQKHNHTDFLLTCGYSGLFFKCNDLYFSAKTTAEG